MPDLQKKDRLDTVPFTFVAGMPFSARNLSCRRCRCFFRMGRSLGLPYSSAANRSITTVVQHDFCLIYSFGKKINKDTVTPSSNMLHEICVNSTVVFNWSGNQHLITKNKSKTDHSRQLYVSAKIDNYRNSIDILPHRLPNPRRLHRATVSTLLKNR